MTSSYISDVKDSVLQWRFIGGLIKLAPISNNHTGITNEKLPRLSNKTLDLDSAHEYFKTKSYRDI